MRKRILSAWAVALLLGQVSLVHAQENEESHFWASARFVQEENTGMARCLPAVRVINLRGLSMNVPD